MNDSKSLEDMNEDELTQLARQMEEQQREAEANVPQQAARSFYREENENLVKWQLDIKEELARIEHLLRKHVPKTDKNGNIYYDTPDETEKLFNETGINEILNILAWYLNKNIILSDFEPEEINQRCSQFFKYLSDFIFNNYERFGLNNEDKIKHYPMVVINIVNTVEAAYKRAQYGGERESLRTARQVHQQEPIQQYGYPMQPQQQKNKSLLKPWTWGR